MNPPILPVGFDYAQTVLEIRHEMTYEQIAEVCGFASKAEVARVVAGKIPHHPQGEAIWVVYCELFGKKPPMPSVNLEGIVKVSLARRHRPVISL